MAEEGEDSNPESVTQVDSSVLSSSSVIFSQPQSLSQNSSTQFYFSPSSVLSTILASTDHETYIQTQDTDDRKPDQNQEHGAIGRWFSLFPNPFFAFASCCWVLCPPVPSCAISKVAFRPPSCSYYFKTKRYPFDKIDTPKAKANLDADYSLHFLFDITGSAALALPRHNTTDAFFVAVGERNRVACLLVRSRVKAKYWLIYSHSNATDLGDNLFSIPGLQLVADYLSCNICIYDYNGYGLSDGGASEHSLYEGIGSVVAGVCSRYGLVRSEVVLWGYSLGTAASVHVAALLPDLGGLILAAPFMSAIRIIFSTSHNDTSCNCDQLTSIDKISSVRCPTLICHGTEDALCPLSHAVMLHSKCTNPTAPCYLSGRGHDDIESDIRYYKRIYKFLHTDIA